MLKRRHFSFISVATVLFSLGTSWAAGDKSSIASLLPEGAVIHVQATDLGKLVETVRESKLLETAYGSDPFKALEASPQFAKVKAGIALAEHVLRMNLWDASGKLLAGKLGIGFYPKDGSKEPDAVFLMRHADVTSWNAQREWIDPLLTAVAQPLESEEGVVAFKTPKADGKRVFVALHDEWSAVSTDSDLLEKTVALQTSGKKLPSLGDNDRYQSFASRLGDAKHLLTAFVDTEVMSKAFGKRFGIPDKFDNPMGSLLVGGIAELAAASSVAGLTADIDASGVDIKVLHDGSPKSLSENYKVFFSNHPTSGTKPLPKVANRIGGLTLYRDIDAWYRLRDQLIQEQVLPEFDKFETGLGNVLPGKDFGEDVLPLIGDNITFVSAVQDYEHLEGKLGVELPAFALIIDLAEPEEGEAMFKLFVQTLLAVLNLEAAKQQRQPWLIDATTHNEIQITTARYMQKPKGDDLPIIFNFLPAAARVGDQYVISTSLGLCEDLIDALKSPDETGLLDQNFGMQLDITFLVKVLRANSAHFMAQRLAEGRSVSEAKSDVDLVLGLLEMLKELRASTSATAEGFTLRFQGEFNR